MPCYTNVSSVACLLGPPPFYLERGSTDHLDRSTEKSCACAIAPDLFEQNFLDNRTIGVSQQILTAQDREAEFPPGHFDVSECKLLSCQDLLTDPYSDSPYSSIPYSLF